MTRGRFRSTAILEVHRIASGSGLGAKGGMRGTDAITGHQLRDSAHRITNSTSEFNPHNCTEVQQPGSVVFYATVGDTVDQK